MDIKNLLIKNNIGDVCFQERLGIMKERHYPKYFNFDIVFQEVPDEVTLAINITHCPFRCAECHSPHLRKDIGTILDEKELDELIVQHYGITCVCFMGGDGNPFEINLLASYIKHKYSYLKTAWYSGADLLQSASMLENMDYIKIGPYKKEQGGLHSKTTNQRIFKKNKDGVFNDITYVFWNKGIYTLE